MAGIPGKSRAAAGFDRFLCGTDIDIQGAVRIRGFVA
jgi:hypothetical protein